MTHEAEHLVEAAVDTLTVGKEGFVFLGLPRQAVVYHRLDAVVVVEGGVVFGGVVALVGRQLVIVIMDIFVIFLQVFDQRR